MSVYCHIIELVRGEVYSIKNMNALRTRNSTSSGILHVSVNNVMKTNKTGQEDRNNYLGIKVKVVQHMHSSGRLLQETQRLDVHTVAPVLKVN